MAPSRRLTRRAILTLAAPTAALGLARVGRAQPLADPGCAIGFRNGLLQFDPACPLVSPPA